MRLAVLGVEPERIWPTPTAKGNYNRAGLSAASGDGLSAVKMWPTATASDTTGPRPVTTERGPRLSEAVKAVVKEWATPTARDWKSGSHGTQGNARPLSEQVGLTTPMPLNPAWVEQLMGFPDGWTDVGPPAGVTSSMRGKRRGQRAEWRNVPLD